METGHGENNGIIANTTNDEGTQAQPQEQNIPYSRFKAVNDKYKETQSRLAELERKFAENVGNRRDLDEYRDLAQLPIEEALAQIEDRAISKAIKEFENHSSKKQSEIDKAQEFIDEGFDYLRDKGYTINDKLETELSKFAIDYNINLSTVEDFTKVYDLYSKVNKTSGTGNSSRAETIGTQQRNTSRKTALNTSGSMSDVLERFYTKHGIR